MPSTESPEPLRARHPVLAAPEIALGVENELAIGAHSTTGKAEREGEIVQ
jgi:hypothetical protein